MSLCCYCYGITAATVAGYNSDVAIPLLMLQLELDDIDSTSSNECCTLGQRNTATVCLPLQLTDILQYLVWSHGELQGIKDTWRKMARVRVILGYAHAQQTCYEFIIRDGSEIKRRWCHCSVFLPLLLADTTSTPDVTVGVLREFRNVTVLHSYRARYIIDNYLVLLFATIKISMRI
ncbi:hypothetical protein CBL_03087 [Carabus blaptoides fortunei]